jgi:hypothetical protein
MPLYEFKRPDGTTVEAIAPSGCSSLLIGGEVCHRSNTPSRIALVGLRPQSSQNDEIRRGYYKEELKGGPWKSALGKSEIKRILEDNP